MSRKKPSRPSQDVRAVLSVDGKLLAGEGVGDHLPAWVGEDLVDEIHVEILPQIIGGEKVQTLTGTPGDFLPQPLDFLMISMKVVEGRCVATYRRVSDRVY
jgi:hypothetical protein